MFRRLVLPCMLLPLLAGCMEGTKEERRSREPSLYDRLGQEAGITKVVDDFIVIVIEDPKIKEVHKEHFKDEKRVGELKKKLVDQIGQATGGPQKYQGRDMKTAHKGMKISNADFDALAGDLAAALKKNNVGDKEQNELLALLGPMRKDVVEEPEAKENP